LGSLIEFSPINELRPKLRHSGANSGKRLRTERTTRFEIKAAIDKFRQIWCGPRSAQPSSPCRKV
jgi:hypothetical protein